MTSWKGDHWFTAEAIQVDGAEAGGKFKELTLPKPYYQDDAVTIYHGDCRDILPLLPKVDLVLTDPPYGVNGGNGTSGAKALSEEFKRHNNWIRMHGGTLSGVEVWLAKPRKTGQEYLLSVGFRDREYDFCSTGCLVKALNGKESI